MKNLVGKAIVVTGSGRGIGRATALGLAAEGARVMVNDVSADVLDEAIVGIRTAGGEVDGCVADISTWEGAQTLIARCIDRFGRIDGLVNNAGLFHMALPTEEDAHRIRRLMEVNVLGSIFCGQAAAEQMQAQGSGAIVNVTSGAHAGISGMGTYGASKGAVASLTYSWAIDLHAHGIRVNAVSPLAESRMNDSIKSFLTDHGRAQWNALPPPSHNVPLIAFLLSDLSADITGQVIRVDAGGLSMLSHPSVFNSTATGEHASIQDVARAFNDILRANVVPLGMATIRGDVEPFGMHFSPTAERAS